MEKMDLNKLKSILFLIVQKNEDKKRNIEYLKTKVDILDEFVSHLKGDDYEKIYSEIWSMDVILPLVFDAKKSQRISTNLINVLNSLKIKLNKRQVYDDELKLKSQFNSIIQELELDLLKLKTEYKIENESYNEEEAIRCRKIISKLNFASTYITIEEFSYLEEILDKYDISDKEQIRILEGLKNHNQRISSTNANVNHSKFDRHTVFDMLNIGYEKYDIPYIQECDSKNKIDSAIGTYLSIVKDENINNNEVVKALPKLSDKIYSFEEFDAIMINILINFQEQLYEDTQYFSDKSFYKDIKIREDLTKHFNETINRYTLIRNHYYKEKDIYEQNMLSEETYTPKNNLFFLKKKDNESYLEDDLQSIPNEYLYKIKVLLTKLEQDKLSPTEAKRLTDSKIISKMLELRDDQIRISYYHLDNNNYLIVGCGVKKQNNDRSFYRNMSERRKNVKVEINTADKEEMDISKRFKDKIYEYIDSNKRKGIR